MVVILTPIVLMVVGIPGYIYLGPGFISNLDVRKPKLSECHTQTSPKLLSYQDITQVSYGPQTQNSRIHGFL